MAQNRADAKHNETVRDYQFDTIKGLMILLVVFCHVLSHLYKGWSIVRGSWQSKNTDDLSVNSLHRTMKNLVYYIEPNLKPIISISIDKKS